MDTQDYVEIQGNSNFITDIDIGRAEKSVRPKEYAEKKKKEGRPESDIKRTPEQVREQRKEAIKAFEFFDKDGSGFINATELKHLFLLFYGNSLTERQIDDFLMEADIDENNHINYMNFVNIMIK